MPEPIHPKPAPFYRQVVTFVPPWDPDAAVTLELIVLAPETRDDERSAARDQVPELQQAGWREWGTPALDVFCRVIV